MPVSHFVASNRRRLSDLEFERTGSTPWIKAIEKAQGIAAEILHCCAQSSNAAVQLSELEAAIDAMSWREDELDVLIDLALGPSVDVEVPLRDAPAFLRMLIN